MPLQIHDVLCNNTGAAHPITNEEIEIANQSFLVADECVYIGSPYLEMAYDARDECLRTIY